MARFALLLALFGCGLTSRDVDVTQDFQAGGGPPTADVSLDGSKLSGPFTADVHQLSSVTLKSARLDSTDGSDLSFVSGATLSLTGNGLPALQLATLGAPGAVTTASFTVDSRNLKDYLQAGATLAAQVTYLNRPVTARGLRLTLTLHGQL